MSLQVSVPSGCVDESAYHKTAAISVPQPKPDCRKPAPFARACSGQVSDSSAMPVLHSLPMARPVTKRSPHNTQKVGANAVKPENIA